MEPDCPDRFDIERPFRCCRIGVAGGILSLTSDDCFCPAPQLSSFTNSQSRGDGSGDWNPLPFRRCRVYGCGVWSPVGARTLSPGATFVSARRRTRYIMKLGPTVHRYIYPTHAPLAGLGSQQSLLWMRQPVTPTSLPSAPREPARAIIRSWKSLRKCDCSANANASPKAEHVEYTNYASNFWDCKPAHRAIERNRIPARVSQV